MKKLLLSFGLAAILLPSLSLAQENQPPTRLRTLIVVAHPFHPSSRAAIHPQTSGAVKITARACGLVRHTS